MRTTLVVGILIAAINAGAAPLIKIEEIFPPASALGSGWTSNHIAVLVDRVRPTNDFSTEGKGWPDAAHRVVGTRGCEAYVVMRYYWQGSGSTLVWVKRYTKKEDIGNDWGTEKETKDSLDRLPNAGEEVRFYQRHGRHNNFAFRRDNFLVDVEGPTTPIEHVLQLKKLAEVIDRRLIEAHKELVETPAKESKK
jgi:hypothetical protein